MKATFLVQRLQQPIGRINPCSFGGGGGRMNKEAMEMLAQIWSWDYMGAAEFEFGAVPDAFNKMIGNELVASFFTIPYKYERKRWRNTPTEVFEGKAQVFYVCIKEQEDEVKERLRLWAKKEPEYRAMKESLRFNEGIAEVTGAVTCDIVGWFELDNGFFFFSDEKMWRKTCEMLEIKVPSKKKVKKLK